MENKCTIPTRTSLMRVLGRMLGENTRRKLNKFGMKTKKQVRYPRVAYSRGYKCENIEIIPMIREALFHRLTL